MSDTTPPRPIENATPASDATDSSGHHYAFLVHSQRTLTQNLPPKVDNKLLARQKRRRTSPEDHAILEAEYQKDPKPDKLARLDIVNRVALGEKEVQIWFQNRRQNDRRRSRPLLPHEISPPSRLGAMGSSSPETIDASAMHSDPSSQATDSSEGDASQKPVMSSQIQKHSFKSEAGKSFSTDIHRNAQDTEDSTSDARLAPFPGESQLGKRKRHSESMGSAFPRGGSQAPVRISTSLDGEARIRLAGETTPSPPKHRMSIANLISGPREALQRSRSSTSLHELTRGSGVLSSSHERAGLRRSLTGSGPSDFFCDGDARNVLAARADQEQDGSATGAISLVRSRSQRSLQRSNSAKRSALGPKNNAHNVMEPSPQQTKKQRVFSRAASSLGRLQGGKLTQGRDKAAYASKRSTDKDDIFIDGADRSPAAGDSDKENWVPGTQTSTTRLGGSTVPSKAALGERIGSQNVGTESVTGKMRRVRRIPNDSSVASWRGTKENQKAEMEQEDEEVAAFMSGATVPAREEDLDCIQGLLSLSQGAWR